MTGWGATISNRRMPCEVAFYLLPPGVASPNPAGNVDADPMWKRIGRLLQLGDINLVLGSAPLRK